MVITNFLSFKAQNSYLNFLKKKFLISPNWQSGQVAAERASDFAYVFESIDPFMIPSVNGCWRQFAFFTVFGRTVPFRIRSVNGQLEA